MWNLIVSADETAWEGEGRFSIPRSRFAEFSGDEAASIDLASPESLRTLGQVHTALMYEDLVDDPHGEVVRIGELRDIQAGQSNRDSITFRFREIGRSTKTAIRDLSHRIGIHEWEYSRTHWSIKDGSLPQELIRDLDEPELNYDVVLSFAGEERAYVEEFANILVAHGLEVFYDKMEEANLWGKDLVTHFQRVYRDLGRYCVMFISADYESKVWTRHERRSALERALQERDEYILPVKFDETNLPGLSTTTGYLPAAEYTPDALARILFRKLGRAF